MDRQSSHPREGRRRALALLGWLPILALLVNSAVVASLPHSAWGETTALVDRAHVMQVFPQGWAFFTRDPREPRLHVYARSSAGEWDSLGAGTNGEARWAFGLRRNPRLQGIETGGILAEVGDEDWMECERGDPAPCLDRLAAAGPPPAENRAVRPQLCGTVGLVHREPVPWAWHSRTQPVEMPQQAVVLEVACPRR